MYYTTENKQLVCVSYNGYGLRYDLAEVPTTGARAAGVKCMDLRDDTLVSVLLADEQSALGVLTTRGSFKKMKVTEIPMTSRARRGVQILRELKSKLTSSIHCIFDRTWSTIRSYHWDWKKWSLVEPNTHNFNERYSNGSYVFDAKTEGEPQNIRLYTLENTETE